METKNFILTKKINSSDNYFILAKKIANMNNYFTLQKNVTSPSVFEITTTTENEYFTLNMNGLKDWGDGTRDELNQHSYIIPGEYTIKCLGDTITTTHGLFGQGENNNITVTNIIFRNISAIPSGACKNCISLQQVDCTNIKASIADDAFNNCLLLKDFYISPFLAFIYSGIFTNCPNLRYIDFDNAYYLGTSNKKYTILIKAKNTTINSCILASNAVQIASLAFSNCTKLGTIIIPDNIITIGSSAFSNCSGLQSVTIGNSVTSIGREAFYYCRRLTSIEVPDSVESIGNGAFSGCSGLTAVHITDLATWCNIEFGNAYANPLYYAKNLYLNGELVTDLVIPDTVTEIKSYAFYGCSGLTSVTIGNGVASISRDAFNECSSLTSVAIPDSMTSIGIGAFKKCSGLTSITIPDSVISIGATAFQECSGLTSVIISSGITAELPNGLFWNCPNITTLTLPFIYSKNEYSTCLGQLFGATSYIGSIPTLQYYYPSSTSTSFSTATYYIPGALTTVNFTGQSVPHGAFSNCTNLTHVTFTDTLTTIGDRAFYGCTGISNIDLCNNINSLGKQVFYNCNNLTGLQVSSTIESIGSEAFVGCPLNYNEYNNINYLGNYNNPYILLMGPDITATSYSISSNTYIISTNAFKSNHNLTEIIFPIDTKLKTILTSAFEDTINLTTINLPDTITKIGPFAFSGCGLTQVILPASLEILDAYSFEGCPNLSTIYLPASLTKIESWALQGNSRLNNISFGGTKQQWRTVELAYGWHDRSPATVVHCIDGDVNI